MGDSKGWIKIHRKLQSWEWYQDSKMVHVFIHLLFRAAIENGNWKGVPVCRGQVIIGRKALSAQTGISEQSLRTCLKRLKSSGEIMVKSTSKFTVVTLCNYETYNTTKKPDNQQSTSNQPAINQQSTTKKKLRSKEVKKTTTTVSGKNTRRSPQPPFSEIVSHFNEKAGTSFMPTSKATRDFISARFSEGFTAEDCKMVIDHKCEEWRGDEKMDRYLRPQTLFCRKNFEGYLVEARKGQSSLYGRFGKCQMPS